MGINFSELVPFLETHGIDATKVPNNSKLDESGYDYYVTLPDGRPVYDLHNRIKVERHTWPSAEVWRVVSLLMSGGSIAAESAPDPAPATITTPEEKVEAEPAPPAAKPVAKASAQGVRKKGK